MKKVQFVRRWQAVLQSSIDPIESNKTIICISPPVTNTKSQDPPEYNTITTEEKLENIKKQLKKEQERRKKTEKERDDKD